MSETFQAVFDGIFQEAFELLVERQRKYGPKNVESLGLYGVFNRLSDDKVERIRRAMNGKLEHGRVVLDDIGDFGDESFEDALFDIANYALIMIALKRGQWGKPLDEDVREIDELVAALSGGPVLNFEPSIEDCDERCCARPNAWAHEGPCYFCVFHAGDDQ